MDAMPLLEHIPLSHYSEKARWALDYKGVEHRRKPPGFFYLFRNWFTTRQVKFPILWLDGRAIADSTRIIAALEQRYPRRPLYPAEPALRERALAIEEDLDETLGPALRAAFLGPLLRADPELALRHITTGWPQGYRKLRPMLRLFPAYYRFRHKIRDDDLAADRATVAAALDRIETTRQGRRYLVGDDFTVADLTAAALLAPLLQPPEIQYPTTAPWPPVLAEYRGELLGHPAARWAAVIYQLHRGRSAEVRRQVQPLELTSG